MRGHRREKRWIICLRDFISKTEIQKKELIWPGWGGGGEVDMNTNKVRGKINTTKVQTKPMGTQRREFLSEVGIKKCFIK